VSGPRPILVVALVGAIFGWGTIRLFDRQFAAGELYPEFSSLRTDRMGSKLLYDSLGKLPGITVERNFLPFEFLPRDGAALLLVGTDPMRMNWNDAMLLRSVEDVAARGNRVVVAMHIDPDNFSLTQRDFDVAKGPKAKAPPEPPLKTRWKVTLRLDRDRAKPRRLTFGMAEGWKVLERADEGIRAIEREFGKGSVVLMAGSGDFTNKSAVEMDRLHPVAWALSGYRRIVFDEQHLGVAESGSIVGMARQFRLTGLAIGLALVAGLFIWRNAAAFPPPVAGMPSDRLSGRTSHAGLLTLLKRHIPPAELAAVCWREWLATNGGQASPEVRTQAEAVLARAGGNPVETAREIQTLLDAKGRR
jgi:hypothetical protein